MSTEFYEEELLILNLGSSTELQIGMPSGPSLELNLESDPDISLNHFALDNIGTNTHVQIDAHIADLNNPHATSKAQVGLSNVPNLDTSTTANITDSLNKRFLTDAELTVVQNTSNVNTGDQDLSGKENVGVAAGLMVAHEAALDPHPQYLTPAEAGAAYAPVAHGHPLSQLTQSGATLGQIVYWDGVSWVPYTQPVIVFNHLQSVTSLVWTITHNLGFYPAVMVIDGTGSVIVGQVFHVSVNQLTITFLISIDGAARLN